MAKRFSVGGRQERQHQRNLLASKAGKSSPVQAEDDGQEQEPVADPVEPPEPEPKPKPKGKKAAPKGTRSKPGKSSAQVDDAALAEAQALVDAARERERQRKDDDRKRRTLTVLLPHGEELKERIADAAHQKRMKIGAFVEAALVAYLDSL